MSKRFLWLCVSVLIVSNIYFVNLAAQTSFTGFTFSELLLGKILNQGTHWLIIFYLIIKRYWEFNNSKVHLVVLVFLFDILNEAVYYFSPQESYAILLDSIFVDLERIGWLCIFMMMGGKIWVRKQNKNRLTVWLLVGVMCFYFVFFQNDIQLFQRFIIISFMLLLVALFAVAMNTKNTIWHAYTYGVLLIILGDLAFVYSEFHDDLDWRYLYTVPKFLINVGELLIVYHLLRKYQYIN